MCTLIGHTINESLVRNNTSDTNPSIVDTNPRQIQMPFIFVILILDIGQCFHPAAKKQYWKLKILPR